MDLQKKRVCSFITIGKFLITIFTLNITFIVQLPVSAQTNQNGKGMEVKLISNLPSKDKRWALIIGVDEYQDDNISDLRGAANDTKYLAD